MHLETHELLEKLKRRERVEDWSPEEYLRPLRSFENLSLPSTEEQTRLLRSKNPQDQLGALAARYQSKELQSIRRFFSRDRERLGNKGKLLLLLAYLELFRGQSEQLFKYALPLADELARDESSGFGTLRDWLKIFLQGRDLPPEFHQRAGTPKDPG
jgi:hypothetical protein